MLTIARSPVLRQVFGGTGWSLVKMRMQVAEGTSKVRLPALRLCILLCALYTHSHRPCLFVKHPKIMRGVP